MSIVANLPITAVEGHYPKTASAALALHALNPDVQVRVYPERLTVDNVMALFQDYDVIVDGSDNFPTRYLVNDAAVLIGKPVVHGSIFQFEADLPPQSKALEVR